VADADKRSYFSQLVRKCREDDERAWHELIDVLAPTIFSLCRKSRLSRDESFDIYGQVCLELLNTIGTLRNPEKVICFAATITRRRIYAFYRKVQLLEFLDDQRLLTLIDDPKSDPEADYERIRDREILFEAMGQLSERDRRLIMMLFFDPDEPTYEEISRILKMPVSSIGPIRGKILKKMYRLLKQKRFRL
jgi:RNA polymerase sigma factor (sigma-70 family)